MATTFALDVSRLVKKAMGRADVVIRKVALDVTSRVVQKSPVDTGRFRGSWVASVGAPSREVPGTLDKQGAAAVVRMAALAPGVKAGDTIYLVSNLPYSVRLEYGHSKQAPAGVVRPTVAEFSTIVTAAVNDKGK
jgi:hypothetical protein